MAKPVVAFFDFPLATRKKILSKRCRVIDDFGSRCMCLDLLDPACVFMTWDAYLARFYCGVQRHKTI
jgi:hypothetical protein